MLTCSVLLSSRALVSLTTSELLMLTLNHSKLMLRHFLRRDLFNVTR